MKKVVAPSSVATTLARECGAGLEEAVAGNIADPHQLVSLLVRLSGGDFLFLDEIHRLDRACEEWLYSALAEGCVHVVLRERGRVATGKARALYGARGRPRGVPGRADPRRPFAIPILPVRLRL